MKKITLVLPGQPKTKKNTPTLTNGQARVLPSAAYRKYERRCRDFLKPLRDAGKLDYFTMPVRLTCLYYLENRKSWPDLIGLMQATADILSDVKEKKDKETRQVTEPREKWLLFDDRIVRSWNGSKIAGIDKNNPRVEIEIVELEVDMENALDPVTINLRLSHGKLP